MTKPRMSIFENPIADLKPEPVAAQVVAPTPAPSTTPKGTKRTVVYMPNQAYEILRDAAHLERCSINDLILEGLDHVLKVRSHPSTKELKAHGNK